MQQFSSPVEQFHALPRQGSFEDKRLLILQEAARLFVENGAHETTLSDIAALFGISKPALYHYARSKDDIIAQILVAAREGNREMLELFTQPFNSGSSFDFASPDFWARIAQVSQRFSTDTTLRQSNASRGSRHFLYMNRTFFGLYNLLYDLKAHIRVRNFEKYLHPVH